MGINPTSGTGAVNWGELLAQVENAKTGGTEGAGGVFNGKSVTITTQADGTARTLTVPVPDDLDLPATVDQAAIDSLCEKLAGDASLGFTEADVKAIHDKLTEAYTILTEKLGDTPAASSLNAVFFDLYRLMLLLVEVAQKQRDSTREMRYAENLHVQQSILNQAEQQKTAATIGMAATFACCVVQVGFSGWMLSRQTDAFKSQIGSSETHGIDAARQNLEMVEVANSSEQAATQQFNKVNDSLGQKPSTEAGKTVSEVVADRFSQSTAEGQKYEFQKSKAASDHAHLEKLQQLEAGQGGNIKSTDMRAGQTKTALEGLEKYNAFRQAAAGEGQQPISEAEADQMIAKMEKLDAAPDQGGPASEEEKAKLTELKQQFDDLKTSTQCKNAVKEAARVELPDAQKADSENTVAVENARTAYRNQYVKDLGYFESKYDAARHEVAAIDKNTPPDQAKAMREDLVKAKNQLDYARAYAYKELAKPELSSKAMQGMLLQSANEKVSSALQDRSLDTRYIKATFELQRGEAQLGIINAIGNALQGIISNGVQYQQAEASKQQAQQQKEQEQLDQTKDLFNQAQELVNNCVQLMQAVRSAEAQSMRDAIQA